MSEIGSEIIQGLQESIDYMEGTADKTKFAVHEFTPINIPESIDVKEIRKNLGLSQPVFASAFGLSLHTLRNWEQGRRQPDPAARAYLKVISAAPETVRKALLS